MKLAGRFSIFPISILFWRQGLLRCGVRGRRLVVYSVNSPKSVRLDALKLPILYDFRVS